MVSELNTKPSLAAKLVTTTSILEDGIKTLKKGEYDKSKLEEEARHLDSLYDILECYPDEFGVPRSFNPIAMPYLQELVRCGCINELEMEELNIKSSLPYYRAFDWRA